MKTRIIKRTYPSGDIKFIIQEKKWFFGWHWADKWTEVAHCPMPVEFSTLKEAKDYLVKLNTPIIDEIIS